MAAPQVPGNQWVQPMGTALPQAGGPMAAGSMGQGAAPHGGGGPGFGQWQDPQVLLQLEMARQLRMLRRDRRSGSSASGSHSSEEGSGGSRGGGGKLKALLYLRRRVRKRPLRIIMKYRERCLRRLGIYQLPNGMLSAAYTHPATSLHLRPTFGRMTGLWRCHYGISQLLELIEHRQMEQAGATAVQLLKAIHQTALDGGSWNSAIHLLPWDDPLQKDLFGGDEQEMMAAAAWNRGIKDLQLQVSSFSTAAGGGGAHHDAEETPAYNRESGESRGAKRAAAAAKAKAKALAAASAATGAGR